jgi:hypothetical protein
MAMFHLTDPDHICEEEEESAFCVLLAPSDDGVVVFIKSYFDESYDKDILCVAGYVFNARNGRLLDAEWKKMLWFCKRLPYFRMSACNQGEYPFDRLSEPERIAAQTKAISLISEFASFGSAITVDQREFYRIVTEKGFVRSSYEFCTWMVLVSVLSWLKAHPEVNGASYFFEAGHEHETQSNSLMRRIYKIPDLRREYRYISHDFVDKEKVRPTQTADILAWQWFKDFSRRKQGLTRRRTDCDVLIRGTTHQTLHADKSILEQIIQRIDGLTEVGRGNEIAALAIRDPAFFEKLRNQKPS